MTYSLDKEQQDQILNKMDELMFDMPQVAIKCFLDKYFLYIFYVYKINYF